MIFFTHGVKGGKLSEMERPRFMIDGGQWLVASGQKMRSFGERLSNWS
jgi:hypothetical protein